MQVHRNIDHLPRFRNAVVTIGTFDGVHLGHQSILEKLKKKATEVKGETVIITFHPHPRRIIGKEAQPVQLINSLAEKISLLEAAGINHLVVVPFDQPFSEQTPVDYIEKFLIRNFHPHAIIIGYDHRFGRNRAGDFTLLEQYARKAAFELIEIPGKELEEAAISSTRIRIALLQGEIQLAASLLGYDYFFEGRVVKGNQLGRTIGFPTANLALTDNEKLIPANGVYAVMVNRKTAGTPKGTDYKGMMNIGVRPTVDGLHRMIEVNIFDFEEEIYGETLKVTVRKRLRAEQKFEGLEALKAQLARDKVMATLLLNEYQ